MRDLDEVILSRDNEEPRFTLGDVVYFTRQPDNILTCMVVGMQPEDSRIIYQVSPIRFSESGGVRGISPVTYLTYEENLEPTGKRLPT